MAKKKFLIDVYLAHNLGDDMFLDYLVNRYPEHDFVPFYPGKNYDHFFSKHQNIQKFPYGILDKIKRRIGKNVLTDFIAMSHKFDGLIFLGGGIFREEPYWKSLYQYRFEITTAFQKVKKPVYFMGCNFGPYFTKEFKTSYSNLFEICTKVHFRDQKSFSLFYELPNVSFFPDILWDYNLSIKIPKQKILGISIVDPSHKFGKQNFEKQYIKTHVETIKYYLSIGYKVRIFSFCKIEGDLRIAKIIENEIQNIEIINYENDIEYLIGKIGECEKMICARFHSIIIANKLGIPNIPIIYSEKTKNLLDDANFTNKYVYFENLEDLKNMEFSLFMQTAVHDLVENSRKHLVIE